MHGERVVGNARFTNEGHEKFLSCLSRAATRAKDGAGEGNRTLVSSLGSYSSTIELRPRAGQFLAWRGGACEAGKGVGVVSPRAEMPVCHAASFCSVRAFASCGDRACDCGAAAVERARAQERVLCARDAMGVCGAYRRRVDRVVLAVRIARLAWRGQ